MVKKKFKLFILLVYISLNVFAQGKFELNNGYLTDIQTTEIIDTLAGNLINDNILHNRLNFMWTDNSSRLKIIIEARNRLVYGDRVKIDPYYANQISNDLGIMDLSWNLAKSKSFILNTTLDRLNISYEMNKFLVTVGRQRINWSTNFVWNPNDLFNNASFFDFDYIEKPGSDAVRLQYFGSATSSVDAVIKLNSQKQITAAAMYKFNKYGYDIQFLGGLLEDKNLAFGCGWTGNLGGGSFSSEVSYFQALKDNERSRFLSSFGYNYTFENKLFIYSEFLYMTLNEEDRNRGFNEFWAAPQSVKNLSISNLNFLGMAEYPLTPLLKTTLSSIYYPTIKGFYISPQIDYSITENIDISLIGQYFGAKIRTSEYATQATKTSYSMLNLRFKWSF